MIRSSIPWLLLAGAALAQTGPIYSGTFTAQGDQGTVTLVLRQSGDAVSGTLASAGAGFTLEGHAYPDGAGGVVNVDGATLGFEIHLQGETLGLYLFDLDASGAAIVETASEILLTRSVAAAPAPAAPAADNPLGSSPPAPALSAGDPFAGTYSDGALTLTLEGSGGSYRGHVALDGRSYPLTARGAGDRLEGSFTSDGQAFPFTATLQGGALAFETGGAAYDLARRGAGAAATESAAPAGPVLVRGAHADLSRDDALAFIEAFEFSLAQAGYAYAFTEAERQAMLDAIVLAYPQATREEQVVMSRARAIWSEARARWAASPPEEQRAFVLAVFRLALGEEAVRALAGSGGGGRSGSGGCATFEDCAGAYMDFETWSDTSNAMSCWAAAGCDGYDPIDDSFTYDSYDTP